MIGLLSNCYLHNVDSLTRDVINCVDLNPSLSVLETEIWEFLNEVIE